MDELSTPGAEETAPAMSSAESAPAVTESGETAPVEAKKNEHTSVDPSGKKTADKGDNPGIDPIWIVLLAGLWIYIMWSSRKQKKKATDRKEELSAIKKGDRIVTIGRLHGIVVSTDDTTVTFKTDAKGDTTLKVDKAAVAMINPEADEKK